MEGCMVSELVTLVEDVCRRCRGQASLSTNKFDL